MKRIKRFIQENYKLIIPIALIVVLFASFLIYYKIAILSNQTKDTKDNFYQYFYNKKYEYSGIVTTNRKDVIVNFKSLEYDITLDSTPIYYKNKNKVIFPKDMSVVMPTLNCAEYLALGYSYLNYEKKNYILTTKQYNKDLGHYFLYDGNDLYFFIDSAVLNIQGKEYKLSPMSYVIADTGKQISYYDRDNDKFETIETNNNEASVSNDYYKIFVSRDNIDYYGTNVILTSDISNLNTIDKKG